MILRRAILMLFLWCWPLAVYAAPMAHWQAPEYIEHSFYEIALQNEYRKGETRTRKWYKPLAVYVKHQVGDAALNQRLLAMHIRHLNRITGLPIRFVNNASAANVTVYFTRSSKVNGIIRAEINHQAVQQLRGNICLANIHVNGRYEIEQAVVIIPVDRARMHGRLVSCVVEELTQILGLPNDSKNRYPTIFSDRNIYKLLTGLDYLLLKLLYSPQINSGMTRAEIKPIVQSLLKKWQQQGRLATAQKQVLKGELYELMGYR